MTHEGVVKIMQVLVASYPNFHPADMKSTIAVWEQMLQGYSDSQIAKALQGYILADTKGFAPSIGQIVEIATKKPGELTELEAWSMVQMAVRNGSYGAEKEFAALPENIQVAVGSPGQLREWALLEDNSMGVAQSNFLRSYRAVCERAHIAAKLPPELAKLYAIATNNRAKAIEAEKQPETRKNGIPMPEELKERLLKDVH